MMEDVTVGKEVEKKKMKEAIDTGASVSIMSLALAADLGLVILIWEGPSIVMVNGQRTLPLARVEIVVKIKEIMCAKVIVLEMRGIKLLLVNDVVRRLKILKME